MNGSFKTQHSFNGDNLQKTFEAALAIIEKQTLLIQQQSTLLSEIAAEKKELSLQLISIGNDVNFIKSLYTTPRPPKKTSQTRKKKTAEEEKANLKMKILKRGKLY